jgi:sugar phosphate isomerase/epimerase
MRLGAPIFEAHAGPEEWVRAVQRAGYRAAYCPLEPGADERSVAAYRRAAQRADIVIAEVGAWSNPLSPDEPTRREALQKCQRCLELADRIGARACVNVAGSRGDRWDGPSPLDLQEDTFDLIVESVRAIIDAVRPARACYTLETMPWMYPDSPESYLRLLQAVDRERFAVHLDPVNLICSPQRYFANAELLRSCFRLLGPHIRSCHAKDILLRDHLTTHLDEVRPGLGQLDYGTYLRELAALPGDVPLMIEHLSDEGEYRLADEYIRRKALEAGVQL